MKTIDKFRYNNKFCINGVHVEALASIWQYLSATPGTHIIAVGTEADDSFVYTVRILRDGSLQDLRLKVVGKSVRAEALELIAGVPAEAARSLPPHVVFNNEIEVRA